MGQPEATRPRRLALIGIDPGFAATGIATIEVESRGKPRVVRLDVFKTKKENKKRRVLAVEDNVRRTGEIWDYFVAYVGRAQETGAIVAGLAVESMSFPRNASNAGKMCLAWGALVGVGRVTSIPIIQTNAQRVKARVCGVNTASKEDVQAAMLAAYPEVAALRGKLRQTSWEHAHDALAVAHVLLDSEPIAFARRML